MAQPTSVQKELENLTGKKKAAIFILAIGPEASADIYKHLTEAEMEALTTEIASVKNVTSAVVRRVIDE